MDVRIVKSVRSKIRFCLIFFCVCCLSSCWEEQAPASPEIRYEEGKAVAVTFRASEDLGPYRVYLSGEEKTSVLGALENTGQLHTFTPSFPFTAGFRYTIRNPADSIAGFEIPQAAGERIPPELTAIHPLNDTVPENLLKCYFLFSQPMESTGKATDFIEVTELESGERVEVFLELENELWDRDHTRLTLWLDPGRIKTDLIPNRMLGKPLIEGKGYTIRVLKEWRSAMGIPLKSEYTKTIHVIAADRAKPSPETWKLHLPTAGERQQLGVAFSEPIDLLTTLDGSHIKDLAGERVAGEWKGNPSNQEMIFIPAKPWKKGDYRLLIDTSMEDLAGNTVNRLFDTDLAKTGTATRPRDEIVFPFSINY